MSDCKFQLAMEMADVATGLPRLGLQITLLNIEGGTAPIGPLIESGNGWYWTDDAPKGTYQIYVFNATSGQPEFTGQLHDHLAGVFQEEDGFTRTVDQRLKTADKTPQDFGAQGFGNNAESIQDAITQADTQGVKKVRIPPGDYNLEFALGIAADDFVLEGHGVRFFHGVADATFSMLQIEGSNVTVIGIEFIGDNFELIGQQTQGMVVVDNAAANNTTLIGCKFTNGNLRGIKLEQGANAKVLGCVFTSLFSGVSINKNSFDHLAITGSVFEAPLTNKIEETGTGTADIEAAANIGLEAYIQNIGNVGGGNIDGSIINHSLLEVNEFKEVLFGAKYNPDTSRYEKTQGADTAFRIFRDAGFLKIQPLDVSLLNDGDEVIWVDTDSIQFDKDGNALIQGSLQADDQVTAGQLNGILGTTAAVSQINMNFNSVGTPEMITQSVDNSILADTVAGDGLGKTVGQPLNVNVDDTTIEIVSDTLQVKDDGITNDKIGPGAVGDTEVSDVNWSKITNNDNVVLEDSFKPYSVFYDNPGSGSVQLSTTVPVSETIMTGFLVASSFATMGFTEVRSYTQVNAVDVGGFWEILFLNMPANMHYSLLTQAKA